MHHFCFKFLSCILVFWGQSAIGQELFLAEENQLEAYLRPFKTIEVSTVETGVIESIQVREGEVVLRGQTLVRLQRSTLEKALEVAMLDAQAVGPLQTATAELELGQKRLSILRKIVANGHGRKSELEKALADVAVAKGKVLHAQEEIAKRRKLVEQIRSQIARRDIVSPIDGIVLEVHREPGEAVTPSKPILVTVVNLDLLKCVFNVPRRQATQIRNNEKVSLRTAAGKIIEASVQWKSPLVQAESDTVKIIVRVDNSERRYTAGIHCTLLMDVARTSHQTRSGSSQSVSLRNRKQLRGDK